MTKDICDHQNCELEAAHVYQHGCGFALYCTDHYRPAEDERLRRIRRESARAISGR